MEKQKYTQHDFDMAYNKVNDRLSKTVKEACNSKQLKTILRSVLKNTYAASITNYQAMLKKLSDVEKPDGVYRSCALAIVSPYMDPHPDETIKKIIEDLYNPFFSYKQMRIEYETPTGLGHCTMGYLALQMKYLDNTRKESAALSRESKEAIILIYNHFLKTGEMLKWYFDQELGMYELRNEKLPEETLLSLTPKQYSEMLFFDYEADTAAKAVKRYTDALRDDTAVHAAHAAHADPAHAAHGDGAHDAHDAHDDDDDGDDGDGAFSVPPSNREGGSRRRRRTAHRKRKSHRKSKRVHHTRKKHTRRHRHSRHRRHHRH